MSEQECLDWITDNLDSRFELVTTKDGEEWTYPVGDYSGRDFYKNVPLRYLSDEQIDHIRDEVWDDFDFEGYSDETDYELFEDLFYDAFYRFADENN